MNVLTRILPLAACLAATAAVAQAKEKSKPAPAPAVVYEIAVTDDGFEPARLTVKKGKPVKLLVTRKTDKTCAKDLIIDDPPVKADLPLDKAVAVVFTPKKTGELKFGCSMDKMIGGVILVE